MKKIGIKLADGSFYPIIEEGMADKKVLNLTTVHNNQTAVKVDLYRSKTDALDDAEYVDTLQIENLVKHPNGEPDISLDISLDDENNLSAELHDPESGGESHTTVTLASKTLFEQTSPADYSEAEPTIKDATIDEESFPDFTDGEESDTIIEEPIVSDADDMAATVVEEPVVDEPIVSDSDSVSEDEPTVFEDTATSEENKDSEKTAAGAVALGGGLLAAAQALNSEKEVSPDDIPLDIPDDETFAEPTISNTDTSNDEATDFNADTSSDEDIFDTTEMDTAFDSSSDNENPSEDFFHEDTNLDFSDLYDKETAEGHSANNEEEETIKEKTRTPVLICVICAIICIVAVALIFFIIPSKINLIKSRNTKTQNFVETPVAPKVEEKPPVVEEKIESVAAKEDEIVISPTAEIVPEKPAPKKVQETKTIKYKIKWGDTLWDLADSYYKNPWRYKKIARYNGIKNPDHIISGTYILIPAE